MYLCGKCWDGIPGDKDDFEKMDGSAKCEVCGHPAIHDLAIVCFSKDVLIRLVLFLNCHLVEKEKNNGY